MNDSRVVSVNVGTPREFDLNGKRYTSAIWKEPVEGRLAVRGVNIDGDDQADRKNHGGPDQAIYAYALEDYDWWSAELGRPIAPGTFGENLTLAGIDVNGALVGERWRVGNTVLEVAQPRTPLLQARQPHGRSHLCSAIRGGVALGCISAHRRRGRRRGGRPCRRSEPPGPLGNC